MARSCGLERCSFLRDEVHDLASPAVTDDAPFLNARALGLDFFEDLRDALESLGRRGLGVEEFAELLALLVVVRWVPGDIRRLSVEEV